MAASVAVNGSPDDGRRAVLSRRIQLFVAATITYNVIEAAVAIAAGTAASSTALIGFGLDSIIEVSSAAGVAWQFAGKDPGARERPRCGSSPGPSSPSPLRRRRRRIGVDRRNPGSSLHGRDRAGRGQPGPDAAAVLRAATDRSGTALPVGGGRLQANTVVHVPVRGAAGRAGAQFDVRLVARRPDHSPGHRRRRGEGGTRRVARRCLLPPDSCSPPTGVRK
jgi:hypothetical protein